ncbi:MAG: PAS domain-containing protein [Victivallaceae bacterium]|nr:PAS domain-containing protein [Victivallaceae bacterium]
MKWTIRIFCMVIALTTCFAANPDLQIRDEQKKSDDSRSVRSTLRVGFFQKNGFQVEELGHQMSGFGYALMQNLAIYGNVSYVYLGSDKSWAQCVEKLKRGEIDILMGAQISPERRDQFDFSLPIGYFKSILTVRVGNLKYISGDYANWNGMRVGMARSIVHNKHFEAFAAKHGFTYIPVWFEDYGELIEALQNGSRIDAAVTDSLRRMENEWLLASFAQTPFRIMVKKGNQKLLDKLNAAIEKLHSQQPNLANTLYPKYYPFNKDIGLTFSANERAFIANCNKKGKVFTVTINPDRPPFSLVNNHEFAGIIKHISDVALQRTGLNFKWLIPADRAEYHKMIESHRVDLVMDMRANYNRAEQKNFILIPAWLTPPVSMVKRKHDFSPVTSVAALKETEFIPQIHLRYGKKITIHYYDSLTEALKAVKSGKDSLLYLYAATAELMLSYDPENSLTLEAAQGFSADFSVGVSNRIDSAFSSIVSQAMSSLTKEEIYATYDKYTMLQKRELTIADYFYAHPLFFVLAGTGLGVLLLLVISALLLWRHRVYLRLKRANESTRRMLEERSITLKSIGDAVIVTDEFLRINMINPVMEKLCGYKFDEIRGRSAEDMFPFVNSSDGFIVALPLKEAIACDHIVEMGNHTDLICRDGRRIHVADSAAPIHDETGRVTGGIMILRDVSEEYNQRELMLKNLNETRKLNQELLMLQQQNELFFNNMPIYVLTKNIGDHFRYTNCNRSLSELLGKPESKLIGMTDFDVMPDYDRAMQLRKNDEACVAKLRTMDHLVTQETFRYADGQLRYCECYRKIIVDPDGRELLYIVASDITELKQEKQKATENLDWFRMTILSIGDGVIATDPNGAVMLMNPVAERLTAVAQADAVGKPHTQIFKITDGKTRQRLPSPIEQALQSGSVITRTGQNILRDADGITHYISASASPIRNHDSVVTGAILVFRDVTEESNRKNELETALRNFNTAADFAHIASFRLNYRTKELSGSRLLEQFWPTKDGRAVENKEWMHPDDVPFVETFYDDMIDGREESVSFAYRVPHGNEVSYYRVMMHQDLLNPDEITGIVQDITDLATNQNERDKIQSLWKLVINSLPVNLFVKDADDRFKYVICNETFSKFLEKPIEDIIGKTDAELFYQADDISSFQTKDRQVMDGGKDQEFYETVAMKSGELRQFRTIKIPFCKEGERALLIGLSVDVTELRELADTHAMMHKAFETLFGPEALEQKLSTVLEQVCSYIGASRAYIIRDVDGGSALELYAEYIPVDEKSWFVQTKLEIPQIWNDQPLWIENLDLPEQSDFIRKIAPNVFAKHIQLKIKSLYMSPLLLREKRFGQMFFAFQQKPIRRFSNIAENLLSMTTHMLELVIGQNLSRQELEIATKNATAAEKAKGLFIASVSHEIRTPLNAIIGYSELLKNDGSTSKQTVDYLENITYAGNALLQLLNDVLDFSKLEAGQMQLNLEWIDLQKLAGESMRVFALQAAAKHLRLINRVSELPELELDQLRIRQIIFNFMGNALKFTEQGMVELSVTFAKESADRGTLTLAARDTGRGISVEDQAKLMTPFIQLPQPGNLRGAQRGTGLGLAISKQLAEKMGGHAWVKSSLGAGSTFGITLKNVLYRDKARPKIASPENPSEPDFETLFVLLVDDVKMNLDLLRAMCGKLGVGHVLMADSADAAMKIIEDNRVDLVLTDLWMPEVNGVQLAETIRKRGFQIPVFAVTADTDSKENFDRNLFAGVLLKPISMAGLRSVFTEIL